MWKNYNFKWKTGLKQPEFLTNSYSFSTIFTHFVGNLLKTNEVSHIKKRAPDYSSARYINLLGQII